MTNIEWQPSGTTAEDGTALAAGPTKTTPAIGKIAVLAPEDRATLCQGHPDGLGPCLDGNVLRLASAPKS